MHKLKNKHTGEVVTTPYLAEAEEYLNSGDYEVKKPVYTKEMHDRGELPPVGSEVLTVSGVGVVCHHILAVAIGEQEFFIKSTDVNPPPTIEDELCKLVRSYYGGTSKAKDLANEILSKYNITPK